MLLFFTFYCSSYWRLSSKTFLCSFYSFSSTQHKLFIFIGNHALSVASVCMCVHHYYDCCDLYSTKKGHHESEWEIKFVWMSSRLFSMSISKKLLTNVCDLRVYWNFYSFYFMNKLTWPLSYGMRWFILWFWRRRFTCEFLRVLEWKVKMGVFRWVLRGLFWWNSWRI